MALLDEFKLRYPNANLSKFKAEDFFGKPNVMFQGDDGGETAVFDDESGKLRPSIYFSKEMKRELGLSPGFPLELTLNPVPKLAIPAVSFDGRPHSLGDMLTNQTIFITPTDHFEINFRDIFSDSRIRHYSGKESRQWLAAPNMKYWPQQLNFALWCATTGCGVSSRLLFEDKMKDGIHDVTDSELRLPPQVRAFLWFHVYFTMRRILFQLGGIQNAASLPGDSVFSQTNIKYDVPSYKRLCSEFGINSSSDFRFHKGANHGLGAVYIWWTGSGPGLAGYNYPGPGKFSDEGGKASDGNLIQYIENTESAKQYEYFVTPVSYGLTAAGQARINQSIEAFVYCVLGSQVNVRSSILGNTGSAQEVRREFLVLFEDAIRQPDISKSVQRFQLAVQEAKVKLDLAISPGTWLMPSRMVINTESTIGYNNKLKRADPSMKLGVNSEINTVIKPVGIKHNLGTSKVKLPHASVGHKAGPTPPHQAPQTHVESHVASHIAKDSSLANSQHEINLIVIMLAASATAWFLFR